jgi:Raf kinase inhibitor-like YbhB/YbcL family protein
MVRPGTRTAATALAIVLTACSPSGPTPSERAEVTTMELTSNSFADGEAIPARHTCDGDDVSPPLAWTDVPDGTAAFVLIVDDPDAGGFVHWLLTDIPGDARELPEGAGDAVGRPGPNDFGRPGWGGPCPPAEHRYVFTLFALREPIENVNDADAARRQAEDAALARATLTGRYARP